VDKLRACKWYTSKDPWHVGNVCVCDIISYHIYHEESYCLTYFGCVKLLTRLVYGIHGEE
jgi:hypothetical protein